VKKKRFTEEQIIGVLKEGAAGAKVSELCRRHGISDATFYNWKAKYAGMRRGRAAAAEGTGSGEQQTSPSSEPVRIFVCEA
jgi:transposase-like protein